MTWLDLPSPVILLLFSEHTLCKESIVIVKKLDFEILTYLNVFRPPEFIYAIFYGDVCMYVNMCAGVYMSETDSF